jgi:hypothetical protein
MKRFVPTSVRILSMIAATGITALIVAAHGMDTEDLGAREVLVSAPVTIAATDAGRTTPGDAQARR